VRSNLISPASKRNNVIALWRDYPGFYPSILSFADNHELRKASAVGMAALATIGEGESKQLFKKSQADFARVSGTMSGAEGGWGEGPGYFQYAMSLGFPFMRALANAGGPDYFAQIRPINDWAYNITLPNGLLPNYDDAELSPMPWQLADDRARRQQYLWHWAESSSPYSGSQGELAPDTIAAYDDSVQAVMPAYPELTLMEDTTGAVFRSGSGMNSTYLLFLAENGAAVSPEGHEHPDGLGLVAYSKGAVFLHDSGYLDYTRHGLVNQPQNHNVLLADGIGQPQKHIFSQYDDGTNAYLTGGLKGPAGSAASARAEYAGASFKRTVLFFDSSYFIIFDHASSSYERNYTALFHTGSQDAKLIFEGKGAFWAYGSNAIAGILSDKQIGLFSQNFSKQGSIALQKTASLEKHGKEAHFVTVLLPDVSLVQSFNSSETEQYILMGVGLQGGGEDWILYSKQGGEVSAGGIRTDASWIVVRKIAGEAPMYMAQNGSFAEFEGSVLFGVRG